jgi:hypothetical protein
VALPAALPCIEPRKVSQRKEIHVQCKERERERETRQSSLSHDRPGRRHPRRVAARCQARLRAKPRAKLRVRPRVSKARLRKGFPVRKLAVCKALFARPGCKGAGRGAAASLSHTCPAVSQPCRGTGGRGGAKGGGKPCARRFFISAGDGTRHKTDH